MVEELLGLGELSGIEQADGFGEYSQITGALVVDRAIRLVAAGCFLHQYVCESVSDLTALTQPYRKNHNDDSFSFWTTHNARITASRAPDSQPRLSR